MKKAFISEIYSSVQGEGPYTGEEQIFVRLAGCPLRCTYCDTPDSLVSKGHDQQAIQQVVDTVEAIRKKTKISTVSVTGGEPLAHVGFLEELLPHLKKKKFRIYLETAGVHPVHLKKVLSECDVISMDIKLPSATGRVYWDAHEEFLKIGHEKIFVKVVIQETTPVAEVKRAASLVARCRAVPLFVLQPASANGSSDNKPPSASTVAKMYATARAVLPRVLVMPQQHKLWNVR